MSVESVKLPSSLRTIGNRAFLNCSHRDLTIDVPESVHNVGVRAFYGCKIRLPTSLELLSRISYSKNAFHQVRSVAISSKADLKTLFHFVKWLPQYRSKEPFLNPDMKFRVLHSLSSVALPPMNLHIHESFCSVDFTVDELKSFHNDHEGLLPARVKYEFAKAISSTYAALLRCKRRELPESILYEILPFLGGEALPKAILKEIVAEVGKEMMKREGPELRKKVKQLESENAQLASEIAKIKDENKTTTELDDLRRKIEQLESEKAQVKKENEELRREKDELSSENRDIRQELKKNEEIFALFKSPLSQVRDLLDNTEGMGNGKASLSTGAPEKKRKINP